MKKFLKIFFVGCLFFVISSPVLSAGCPSYYEFQVKNHSFPARINDLYAKGRGNNVDYLNESTNILNEQMSYYEGLLPACVQYFKTTPNPDCSRLSMFAVSYLMTDDVKKSRAKTQILNATTPIISKCPMEYKNLMIFLKY